MRNSSLIRATLLATASVAVAAPVAGAHDGVSPSADYLTRTFTAEFTGATLTVPLTICTSEDGGAPNCQTQHVSVGGARLVNLTVKAVQTSTSLAMAAITSSACPSGSGVVANVIQKGKHAGLQAIVGLGGLPISDSGWKDLDGTLKRRAIDVALCADV